MEHKGNGHSSRGLGRYVIQEPGSYRAHERTLNVHLCERHVTDVNSRDLPSVRGHETKAVARGLRLDKGTLERVELAVKNHGFRNASSFIRAAIERELSGAQSEAVEAERGIVASLNRLAHQLRSIRLRQQAEFAFLDALAKTMLTHLTELPKDSYPQAVARGKARYERFLKSVGMGMNGDSQAAMTELMKSVDDE